MADTPATPAQSNGVVKPGVTTTEFWIALATVVSSLMMWLAGHLPPEYAGAMISLAATIYTTSRTIVKANAKALAWLVGLGLAALLLASPAQAQTAPPPAAAAVVKPSFDFEWFPKLSATDWTAYEINHVTGVATGACSGSLVQLNKTSADGVETEAKFFTPCLLAGEPTGSHTEGSTHAVLGIKLIDVLGLQAGGGWRSDLHGKDAFEALVGISVYKAAQQIIK